MSIQSTLNETSRRKQKRLLIYSFCLGGICCMLAAISFQAQEKTQRFPAAIANDPTLNIEKLQKIKFTNKLQGPIQIKIETSLRIKNENSELIDIKANISSIKELQRVQFTWVVPKDIEIIRGPLQEEISIMKSKKNYGVALTIRAPAKINRKIFLQAKSLESNTQASAVQIYNTIDQEKFEKEINSLQKRAQSHIKDFKKSGRTFK